MFSNKEKTEESKSSYANLPTGSQYAVSFGFVAGNVASVTKNINKHIEQHPNHKVVTLSATEKQGAVVVFEVK